MGDVDPHRLVELAALSERDYDQQVLHWVGKPTPDTTALFQHESLARLTWKALGRLIQVADVRRNDKAQPAARRQVWQQVFDRVRETRKTMPRPWEQPKQASPLRRAAERLTEIHPDDWQAARRWAKNNNKKPSPYALIKTHQDEYWALVREEREHSK